MAFCLPLSLAHASFRHSFPPMRFLIAKNDAARTSCNYIETTSSCPVFLDKPPRPFHQANSGFGLGRKYILDFSFLRTS
jgi:hypothetical protein